MKKKSIFCIVFALFCIENLLLAQRLNIEVVENEVDFPKIIYGRIHDDKFYIFEKEQNLKKFIKTKVGDSIVTAPVSEKIVRSYFEFQESDKNNCTQTNRYKEFIRLLSFLSGKVSALILRLPKDWIACERAIEETLRPLEVPIRREVGDGGLKRIEVETYGKKPENVTVVDIDDAHRENINSVSKNVTIEPESKEKLINPTLTINEESVVLNENGFFIYSAKNSDWLRISLQLEGYELLVTKEKPIVVGKNLVKIANSKMYSERLVFFSKPKATIGLGPLVQLDSNTIFDVGLGLGFGYGRQIPGDERGKRYLGKFGAEYRGLIGDIGIKAGLNYTNAADSVVPYTIAGEALLVYDTPIFNDYVMTRFGVGAQFLNTKIEKQKNTNTQLVEPVYIPEEVLAPLTLLSFHAVFFDSFTTSLNLFYTPLYVANFGFYPSFSPSLELGYKFSKNHIISIISGTDSYRYPTATASTKLQIDYLSLSLKIGL